MVWDMVRQLSYRGTFYTFSVLVVLVSQVMLGCSGEMPVLPGRNEAIEMQASRERGKVLVEGLAACGFCHGSDPSPAAPLSGGQEFEDAFGTTVASNITPHRSALGEWSYEDLFRFLRSSRTPAGHYLAPEYHRGYEWMSDSHTLDVAAYLYSLPPDPHRTPRRTLGFWRRNIWGFFEGWNEVPGVVPSISPQHSSAYGRYLVEHVARCGECHDGPSTLFSSGEVLAGGQEIDTVTGEVKVPGLTEKGFGRDRKLTKDEVLHHLQRDQDTGEGCPTQFYRNGEMEDLEAIATYVATLSEVENS